MKTHIPLRYFLFLFFFPIFAQLSSAQYYTPVNPYTRSLDKTNAKVGTLPGTINVSSFGSATYEIPIFVSPGTAGMQPIISLIYDSRIDNGILGKGWGIAGLSEIRRVSQDYYHDNNVTGVTLQNTDKFALDSNRLILTAGSQYGADGSEYATEIETFVKVIAHGTAGIGPSWFEVKTKDGKTLEYGNTADSKVEAYGSSTVYMWRLNKVTDQNSNSMGFEYYEVNGESYIKQINYTTNTPAGLTTAYNSLKFNYYASSRTDVNTIYVAGSQIPETKLLSSIRMETEGGALVREYQFKYWLDTYTHLNQITEYGSDGTYFNSTVLGWGSAAPTTFSSSDVFNNGIKNKFYLGDFDGDGRTDFVVTENKTSFTSSDKWKLYLATSDGTSFVLKNEGFLDPTFTGFFVSDVDGNGVDDIYWRKLETIPYQCNPHPCNYGAQSVKDPQSNSENQPLNPPPPVDTCWDICYKYNVNYLYYYNNGTTGLVRGNSSYDIVFNNSPLDLSLLSADLDGNGKSDYIALTSTKNIYSIVGITCSSYPAFNYPNDIRILDFNGNGKKDILVIKNSNSTIYEFNSLTNLFVSIYSSSSFPTSSDRLFTGDFNGDKKTDFLSWKSGSGWSLKLSTGTSLVSSTAPGLINIDPDLSTSDNNYYIGDFNGDKKDDILEVYKQSPNSILKIFFSKGGGNFDNEINTFSKATIEQTFFSIGDFNGDGKKDIFYYDPGLTTNYVNICFFHKDEMKHLVGCIANGLNHKTFISYGRINSGTGYYLKYSNAQFPVSDVNGAYYTVSSLAESNGLGTDNTTTNYAYEGLQIHKQGKGSLGFKKITSTDEAISFTTIKEYSNNPDYYFTYLSKVTVLKVSGPQLSQSIYACSLKSYGNKRIFPYLVQTFSYDNLTDFYLVNTYGYDNYGNQISLDIQYRSGANGEATKTVTNQFGTFGNYGISNKVVRSTSASVYTGQPSYTRKIKFTYDTKGNLLSEISDTTSANEVTKTNSLFNSFGLPQQVTISANNLASRTSLYEYDPKSRFITKITNPAGHFVTKTYNPGTGNVLTETDINNKTTTYQFDGFGRLLKTITPQSNQINSALSWDISGTGGTNSLYYQSTTPGTGTTGIPDVFVYYDLLGRELMTAKDGFNNEVDQKKEYNADGTLHRALWLYAPGWTTYLYDDYGRTFSENNNGLITSITYNLGSTTITNPASQSKTTTVNSVGNVIQVTENNNNTINYTFHSSGQVQSISTAGTTVSIAYDSLGRQASVTNPNSGTTTYKYNAYGELIRQTNALGKKDSLQYNTLGQVVSKISDGKTTNYAYYTSGNGIEQVQTITGPDGITQSYNYDSYGRVTQFTENIPGDQNFTTSFGYDSWGNNTSVTYPSGITITNVFNTDGYFNEIKKSGSSIWKLDNVNSTNQPVQYSLGVSGLKTNFMYDPKGFVSKITTGIGEQSFTFDSNSGNLMSRSYKKTNDTATISESFTYDNMNRLYTSQVARQNLNIISYSTNGNIIGKTDAGHYTYDNTKKNAITGITNNPGTISNSDTIVYSASNMTLKIINPQSKDTLYYTYGPDNQRIKSVLKNNGNTIKTKYYSPGYEKEITASGVREIHYLQGPYGLVAVLIKHGADTTLYYTETDHLGSIIGLLNSNGTYAEQYSFDAWGRRRNPANWTYNNVPAPSILDRGFTGHEHVDIFGLINMNGRMYDPILGRFLGVDPIIQSMDNSQSFNGYSYCLNNPLIYTDPSGFDYLQSMKDAYWGRGYFDYRGGIYQLGDEDDWTYYQYTLGGFGPAADLSYNASHQVDYHYNWSTRKYYNNSGKTVSPNEVYNNYVIPNSSLTVEFHPPQSPSENSQQNDQNDPCGIDSWKLFYNIHDAESYLQENEICKKEKFMYITDDQWVLVGPWNDATIEHVSPRRVDRYSKGSIYEDGCIYKVDFFVHTHFNSPEPSQIDRDNGKYYYYPYGVRTLIYYERQYYEFDLKKWGKEYFFEH